MALIDALKKIKDAFLFVFPKPVMPQKRYLLLLVGVIYLLLKGYVKTTPSTYDDQLLEQAHHIALQVLAQDEIDQAHIHYGEAS